MNRSVAVQYDVTEFPVIVFEDIDTGAQQGVFNLTEQDFVTGILVATGAQQKRVYYLTGHGEASVTRQLTGETDDEGFDFAIQGMQRDNYRVFPLNLKQDGAIPGRRRRSGHPRSEAGFGRRGVPRILRIPRTRRQDSGAAGPGHAANLPGS